MRLGTSRIRRVAPLFAVALAFAAVLSVALLVAKRSRPPNDVRTVIDAYLADADAARAEYRDAPVTASGVVVWSARSDEVTTRLSNERSPYLDELAKRATVMLLVDDRHKILADFEPEHQSEALALKPGDRVTIHGRHRGGFFTGVVYDGKVLMTLETCEFVR